MEAKDDGERRLAGCKKDDGPPSSAEICERVAGYLFSVLEAETSAEFLALERFQDEHCDRFQPEDEEISFEQERLHRDFVALLEGFLEAFVRDDVGCSLPRFREAVEDGLRGRRASDATEILESLFDMVAARRPTPRGARARGRFDSQADLACWCEAMRERRRLTSPKSPPIERDMSSGARRVAAGLSSTPLGALDAKQFGF